MRSFVQNPAAENPATATAVAEPAPATSTAVARPVDHGRYVTGDIDKSDVRTPFLCCTQAVGPRSLLFTPGQLILGETAITPIPVSAVAGQPANTTPKIRLLFCKVTKTFVENLPYNPAPGSPRPIVFNTMDEVRAVNGVTEWSGNTPPSYLKKTTGFVLVRAPEGMGDDGMFSIIAGEQVYAPAMVSFQKTSYGAATTLWTDLTLSLKNDPTTTFYDLNYVREKRGQNWVWCAKLTRVRDEKPSEALTTIARKLAGGDLSFDVADETE